MASNIKLLNQHGKTTTISSGSNTTDITLDGSKLLEYSLINTLPVYADNASAISGGLVVGNIYSTSSGELRIVV